MSIHSGGTSCDRLTRKNSLRLARLGSGRSILSSGPVAGGPRRSIARSTGWPAALCGIGNVIRNRHDLGALASLGFANPSAPLFAGANVPSMKASRRSMPPRSRKSSAKAQRMRSNTPSLCQRCIQRWHVWYGGYRSGMSFQGAPVLKTQRMPSSTSRGFRVGLPLPSSRSLEGGIRGAISSHCSFVRVMEAHSPKQSQMSRDFL